LRRKRGWADEENDQNDEARRESHNFLLYVPAVTKFCSIRRCFRFVALLENRRKPIVKRIFRAFSPFAVLSAAASNLRAGGAWVPAPGDGTIDRNA